MEPNNKIIGFHRSRELAERHRRALGAGAKIVARRSGSGRFSKRGHFFEFQLEPENLTRYTVGVTFPFRKDYGSVLAQLYTSKWSSRTKKSLRMDKDKGATREAAVRKVEEVTGYPRAKFWFDLDNSIAVETVTVAYDKKFAEKIVVLSEVDEETETTTYRRK